MEGNGRKGFDRYLSRLDVWAMAFGLMVGWGAFVMPGTTFLPAAGLAGTIIALTANALDEDVQHSMQAGLNAHLSKPVEAETLFKTLEELIS